MSVHTIAPRPEFTAQQKREHVLAYVSSAWGTKALYLREHGLTQEQVYAWKAGMADGDLDNNVIPRHTGKMTREDVAEIRRLRQENARLEKERAHAQSQAEQWEKAADALGKAIDAMQHHGVDSGAPEQR